MEDNKQSAATLDWEDLLDKPRVYVDLNDGGIVGANYVVPLNEYATRATLQEQNLTLQEGLSVNFWTDDGDDEGAPNPLTFQGRLHLDKDANQWLAIVEGNKFTPASQLPRRREIDIVTVTGEGFNIFQKPDQKALIRSSKRTL